MGKVDLDPARLAELMRLANAATDGPWMPREYATESTGYVEQDLHGDGSGGFVVCDARYDIAKAGATAAHIAAADPPTMRALCEEIVKLRAEVGRLRGKLTAPSRAIHDELRRVENQRDAANAEVERLICAFQNGVKELGESRARNAQLELAIRQCLSMLPQYYRDLVRNARSGVRR